MSEFLVPAGAACAFTLTQCRQRMQLQRYCLRQLTSSKLHPEPCTLPPASETKRSKALRDRLPGELLCTDQCVNQHFAFLKKKKKKAHQLCTCVEAASVGKGEETQAGLASLPAVWTRTVAQPNVPSKWKPLGINAEAGTGSV